MNRLPLACLLVLPLLGNIAAGEDPPAWPQWRGPLGTGEAPGDPPVEWSETENVRWKFRLAGLGHSTPVIGNGRAWFTSATEDGKKQYVYCIDVNSGDVLHHKLLFENADPEPLGNPVNSYASPTCLLTPDAVYVHFGTYGTARLDP